MWVIIWTIKFDHFKVSLVLKKNRHFYFALGFYARVYGIVGIEPGISRSEVRVLTTELRLL